MASPASLLHALPVYEVGSSFRLSVLVPVYNERHVVEPSLRRVLALDHPSIRSLELIVVDDGSTDGTETILQALAAEDPRVTVISHERNRGKGAAVRTAIARATGDVIIVHDADLEYDPADIPGLLLPFAKEGADAVFGSRYLSAPYRRALMYRHTLVNNLLTALGNWFTDLALTDLETGYKAVNAPLLKSIPLRSDDYRFEVEITFKLAKRQARIFEVPIRYAPRSYREGKKIRAADGWRAVLAMLRFWFIDDLYRDDEYGSHILARLERARRFNVWVGDTLRPFVGDRVLEIGAGIGNLTKQFIPRALYVASDVNPTYLGYLRSYSFGKPYLRVLSLDAGSPEHFRDLEAQFDTVLMLNVLEHLPSAHTALRNVWSALQPGGRAIILVPQHPALYGTLDKALEHRLRYTAAGLEGALTEAGFRIATLFDFNRVSVPGWWLNGRALRCATFSPLQIKVLELAMPIVRRIDRLWPWRGLSLVAVGFKD